MNFEHEFHLKISIEFAGTIFKLKRWYNTLVLYKGLHCQIMFIVMPNSVASYDRLPDSSVSWIK